MTLPAQADSNGRFEARERVATGSMVRLQLHDDSTEWEIMIVPTTEADPETDRISDQCPIGEALLGRGVGDIVTVEVPSGRVQYRVVAVGSRLA